MFLLKYNAQNSMHCLEQPTPRSAALHTAQKPGRKQSQSLPGRPNGSTNRREEKQNIPPLS